MPNKIETNIETLVNLRDYYEHDTPSTEQALIITALNDSISALKTILDGQAQKRGRKSIAHNVSRETFYEYATKIAHYPCIGKKCIDCKYLHARHNDYYCLSRVALSLLNDYDLERRNNDITL